MNDLQIFSNPEFGQVRTVEIDGTMQAKTDYGKICDSLRQAESLVTKAQSNLDSRIDQLSIVAFGLPGFDEIMNAVIGTLPAKKEE